MENRLKNYEKNIYNKQKEVFSYLDNIENSFIFTLHQ